MIILHLQHLPPSTRSPRATPPRTPNSTQRKPSTAAPGDCGRLPRTPGVPRRGTCSRPAAEQHRPGPRGPGVTSQDLRGTPRRRTCGSGPGRCPPAPSGPGRLTSGGRGRRLSLGVARPRHLRQPGRACGGGGGQRPGLERLRGRTGSESWAIPRDCAARSGGQVGARGGGTGPAPRPAQPAAVRGPPSRRLRSHSGPRRPTRAIGKRPAEHTLRSGSRSLGRGGLLGSDLSRRPELARNFLSSWLKSLLTWESGHHLQQQVPVEFQLRPVLQLSCCKSPTES